MAGVAQLTFGLDIIYPGRPRPHRRSQWLSEAVANFELPLAARVGMRLRPTADPIPVAAYVFAAYL